LSSIMLLLTCKR